MKLTTPLETPRLRLRAYRKEDRDFCISLWCDAENGAYMSDPQVQNLDERYLSFFDEMEDDPDGYYLIAERKDTGEPVGTCCLFPEGENADIGYCIEKIYWRQGIGSEMVKALIDRSKAMGSKAVTAEVADQNAASTGLLRAFGFVPTTATRYKKRGEDTEFDAHIYRLTIQ